MVLGANEDAFPAGFFATVVAVVRKAMPDAPGAAPRFMALKRPSYLHAVGGVRPPRRGDAGPLLGHLLSSPVSPGEGHPGALVLADSRGRRSLDACDFLSSGYSPDGTQVRPIGTHRSGKLRSCRRIADDAAGSLRQNGLVRHPAWVHGANANPSAPCSGIPWQFPKGCPLFLPLHPTMDSRRWASSGTCCS